MKKIVCLFALVTAVGFVSIAIATQPAPEAEQAQELEKPQETAVSPEQEAPALADLFADDSLKTEAGCTPRCSTLHGTACSGAQHTTRCYHVCGEPDICVCSGGAWNCQ